MQKWLKLVLKRWELYSIPFTEKKIQYVEAWDTARFIIPFRFSANVYTEKRMKTMKQAV